MARQQGDLAAARSFYAQSLALRRALGDMRQIAFSLTNLGNVAREQGDLAAARDYYDECLAIRRELGDPRALPFALNNVALVAREQDDYPAARDAYQESLACSQRLEDPRGIAEALEGLAALAGSAGDGARAARLWGAVETFRAAQSLPRVPVDQMRYERDLAAARAAIDTHDWDVAWSEGAVLPRKDVIALASTVLEAATTRRPPPPGVPDFAPRASTPS